jgi:hypothetical protein
MIGILYFAEQASALKLASIALGDCWRGWVENFDGMILMLFKPWAK